MKSATPRPIYLIIIAACFGICGLAFCGLAVLSALPNDASTISQADPTPTNRLFTPAPIQEIAPALAIPTADALITPQASPTPRNLSAELAAITGVRTVRVIEIVPYDAGTAIFLEIDTLRGYDILATAEEIRQLCFEILVETRLEFSVILWDRSRRATNFTWDQASGEWLSSPVMSNPG